MSGKSNGPGTVKPNGKMIRKLRRARCWTFADFEFETDLAVERAAQKKHVDGRFNARYLAKQRQGGHPGLAAATLSKAERGEPVLAFTLKIIALTLEVDVADLIID